MADAGGRTAADSVAARGGWKVAVHFDLILVAPAPVPAVVRGVAGFSPSHGGLWLGWNGFWAAVLRANKALANEVV